MTEQELIEKLERHVRFGADPDLCEALLSASDEIKRLRALEAAHGKCICGHDMCWHNERDGKVDGWASCNECHETVHVLVPARTRAVEDSDV